MPSNLLAADISFPNLNEGQPTDEKFRLITNYLYMLLEQLRYSMGNLGRENFNDAAFDDIVNLITEPVYVQLKDAEDNISSLTLTAEQLISRMTDAEGNISTLQQTSTSMTSQITDLQGNVSTLQQTAAGLTSTVTSLQEGQSQIIQNVNAITASVSSLETGMSQTVRISADGVTITNAAGDTLTIDGGQIDATNLNLSGHITFNDFSSGLRNDITGIESTANDAYDLAYNNQLPNYIKSTYIDSARVVSPTIEGGQIKGGKFSNTSGSAYLEIGGSTYGDMTMWGSGNNRVFRIYDNVGGMTMSSYNNSIMNVDTTGTYPQGDWDFGGADVSGLYLRFS